MKRNYYRNFGDLSSDSVVTDLYNKRINDLKKRKKKSYKKKNYKIKSYDENLLKKSTEFFDNYFNKGD